MGPAHGGSWNSGEKKTYNFFGNRLARRGIVAVIIEYPLAPKAKVNEMAWASAASLKWVKENIESYGGDPNQIFISGHSAGGHLATLISVREEYFDSLGIESPIKGNILIDAGGLDMYGYLQKFKDTKDGKQYIESFTASPENWKAFSPKYHLKADLPPMLLLVGGKTYPSIKSGNEEFFKLVQAQGQDPIYFFQDNKKHVGMMSQFLKTWTPAYDQIFDFMDKQRNTSATSTPVTGM